MALRVPELLEVLGRHQVEHMVVGGVAAVLAGAPILTADLDVLFHQTAENRARLLRALAEVQARYKDPADRRIAPDDERLLANRLNLLRTELGDLDLLATIGGGLRYEDLVERSRSISLAGGVGVRVLDLDAVIETKESAGRPKDLAALPVLRETLRLLRLAGDER